MQRNSRPRANIFADDRGVSAVEFALIAPVALAVLGLAFAGGQALTIYHKTVNAAHTVTDMVSRTPFTADPNNNQAELLASTDLDGDLALSQLVYFPYDTSNATVTMTELAVNPTTNQGSVVWSEGFNGANALQCGVTFNLDPSYTASGATYLLIGTVYYPFQPLGGVLNLPPMTLTSTETLTIRNAPQITVSGAQTQC